MPAVAHVAIHSSQFPEQVRQDLQNSLRSRQVNHKFHYDSHKQTQKWLALHQAYSPSRTDQDCATTYDLSFAEVARRIPPGPIHLVGLGCGGGQKDARLLQLLQRSGRSVAYTPSDVSVAMVLVAQATVHSLLPGIATHPLVCDLATADDLPEILAQSANATTPRLFTFFGMIPNFEPALILPRLARLVRPSDYLLFSANLAPGPDYAAGVRRILPLYDNALTREWLITFLLDLGVERTDGELCFEIEENVAGSGLNRVAAYFHFQRACTVRLDDAAYDFGVGDGIRLFFSYRHTPERVQRLLNAHGLDVLDQWITKSEEEGVFLCRRVVK